VRTPDGAAHRVTTVAQQLTAWSDSRVRLRAGTARSYRSIIEHYLNPRLGRIPVIELTHRDVKKMVVAVILHGGVSSRSLSTESQQRIQSCLSTALRAAVHEGLITVNVAEDEP
jgi:hypothetical protein